MSVAAESLANKSFLDFVLRHAQVKTNVCSRQKWENGYSLERRTVPDYNLIFCRRGKVVWVIDQRKLELTGGDLVLVPPGVQHHAYSLSKRVTVGSIHVEVTLAGGQDVFDLLIPPTWRHVRRGTRLDRYLAGAIDEWDRGDEADALLMLPNWARLISLELLRYDHEQDELRQRPIDPLVAEVMEELNRRVAGGISLAELATWSGFTPQHLNRTFRRFLGVTPLQYLARMRMERAAVLLAEGRLTVRAIAASLGFGDAYYFSRLFKQHYRRSPAQYRESAGSNSPSARSPDPSPFADGRR